MRTLQLALITLFAGYSAMAMLSDEEIREYNASKKITVVAQKNCDPQPLRENPDCVRERFIRQQRLALTANELFVESLNKHMARTISARMREQYALRGRSIAWRLDREDYSVVYSSISDNGQLARERCAVKFAYMPPIITENGMLDRNLEMSDRQICRMLYMLKRDGIYIKRIVFKFNMNDEGRFEELYQTLKERDYPVIKVSGSSESKIFINLDND